LPWPATPLMRENEPRSRRVDLFNLKARCLVAYCRWVVRVNLNKHQLGKLANDDQADSCEAQALFSGTGYPRTRSGH
jgi:hypothetical protein